MSLTEYKGSRPGRCVLYQGRSLLAVYNIERDTFHHFVHLFPYTFSANFRRESSLQQCKSILASNIYRGQKYT